MKFKYIGKCAAGFVELGGLTFKEGVAVDVTDEQLIGKLSNNSHFVEVFAGVNNGNKSGNKGQGSK